MSSPLSFSIEVEGDALRWIDSQSAANWFLSAIQNKMTVVEQEALRLAQRLAPNDTGTFAAGLYVVDQGEGKGFTIQTNDPELASMLRTGTGIYGPTGQRIYATSARAMILGRWKGAAIPPNFRAVWALQSIAGMKANPWEQVAQSEITAMAPSYFGDILRDVEF